MGLDIVKKREMSLCKELNYDSPVRKLTVRGYNTNSDILALTRLNAFRINICVKVKVKVTVKVKCNLVQALRLCTGRTTHKGSRGLALLFLNHGTRRV